MKADQTNGKRRTGRRRLGVRVLQAVAGSVAVLGLVGVSARAADEPVRDVGAETATHVEVDPLPVHFQRLSCLRTTPGGLLAAGDERAREIKILDPSGKVVRTLRLPFAPEALCYAPDGSLYCGGEGQLAHLSADGQILHRAAMPETARTPPSQLRRMARRPVRLSGLAVSDDAVFIAFGSGWSLGSKSKLFRFTRQLTEPRLLAEGLRGCCQRCDIVFHDGVLYVAENAAHRVVRYAPDGRVLGKWGARSRTELSGFGSCCNPMNLAFGPDGSLYTAESGLGRVKRYTPDGKFLGLVGYVGTARFTRAGHLAASCSNIAIAVSPHARRVYVLDYKENLVRVLERKGSRTP